MCIQQLSVLLYNLSLAYRRSLHDSFLHDCKYLQAGADVVLNFQIPQYILLYIQVMKHYLSYLFLIIPFLSFAQSKELLQRIDRYNTIRRLDYEQKYDSIVTIAGKLPFRDSLYIYSTEEFMVEALLHKGDTTRAMRYLEKAIENQSYESVKNMYYSLEAFKLDSNKQYKALVANFDKLFSKYTGTLNLPLLQLCLEIYYTDSRSRYLYLMAEPGSKMQLYADSLQYQSDLMNVDAMKNILLQYKRFPGISDIGKSFHKNFKHILAHFSYLLPQDVLIQYLKEATMKGEIPNFYGPFLIDKRAWQYNQVPETYGEYGSSSDYKDGVYNMPPIADIDYVDKRRAEFLLPPLYTVPTTGKVVLPKEYDAAKQKH